MKFKFNLLYLPQWNLKDKLKFNVRGLLGLGWTIRKITGKLIETIKRENCKVHA